MGFIFVFIGCLFIFNPSYNLIDVLPDFIGIIFILYGISKAADLESHMRAAYVKFKNALWIAAAKFVCAVLAVVGFFDATLTLTASLAAGVLECVFLIPAFSALFDGFSYLAPEGEKSGDVGTLSAVFLIARAAGACVPGIAAMLMASSGGSVTSGGLTEKQISAALNVLFIFGVLIFGIIWLVYVSKKIKPIRKNKELCDSLLSRYKSEVLQNGDVMLTRHIKRFTLLLSVSMIFMITLKAEDIFFMPEFAAGAVLIAALALAGEFGKKTALKLGLAAFTVFGVAEYIFLIGYSKKYGDMFEPFSDKGFSAAYLSMLIPAALCFVIFAVCGHGICRVLKEMAKRSVGLRGEYTDERRREVDEATKKSLCGKITILEIIICIYSAVSIATAALMPFARAMWLSRLACGVILWAFSVYVSRKISTESENSV